MPVTKVLINQMKFNVLECASSSGDFWESVNLGKWEPEFFKFIENYVRPDKNFIDIGGWIGVSSLAAYAYNPKKVYIIEGDPSNFQIIKHNIAMNLAGDKITALQACLTDKANAGKIMMFGTANDEKPNSSSHRLDNGSRIPVKTIDALPFMKKHCELSKGGIYNIDIDSSEKYLAPVFAYLARKDAKILFSLHAPYWETGKEQFVNNLMKEFVKYQIICPFYYTEIKPCALKDKLLDNSPNQQEKGLFGQFFPIILHTRSK